MIIHKRHVKGNFRLIEFIFSLKLYAMNVCIYCLLRSLRTVWLLDVTVQSNVLPPSRGALPLTLSQHHETLKPSNVNVPCSGRLSSHHYRHSLFNINTHFCQSQDCLNVFHCGLGLPLASVTDWYLPQRAVCLHFLQIVCPGLFVSLYIFKYAKDWSFWFLAYERICGFGWVAAEFSKELIAFSCWRLLTAEDHGTIFLWNGGKCRPKGKASYPRILSPQKQRWENLIYFRL